MTSALLYQVMGDHFIALIISIKLPTWKLSVYVRGHISKTCLKSGLEQGLTTCGACA